MQQKGRLIVLEGTDGSGKTTQLKMLCDELAQRRKEYTKLEYPCYGQKSAALVEFYLQGGLGSDPEDVNAYASSSFFACDRYIDYKLHWKAGYENGGLYIAGRYTTSNAVHQAAKLEDEQRRRYLDWLFYYEYEQIKLPRPDLVIFLDLPPEFSFKNIYSRQKDSGDIHELDHSYLRHCYENALDVANNFAWKRIDCIYGGKIRTKDDIHEEIMQNVEKYL